MNTTTETVGTVNPHWYRAKERASELLRPCDRCSHPKAEHHGARGKCLRVQCDCSRFMGRSMPSL